WVWGVGFVEVVGGAGKCLSVAKNIDGVVISLGHFPMQIDPHEKYWNNRVYAYVDGSYVIRGFGKSLNKRVRSDFPPLMLFRAAKELFKLATKRPFDKSDWRRTYWFGSYAGSDEEFASSLRILRDLGFDPFLFRKPKKGKEKQVDTQLVTMMLTDSFKRHFDVALLFSGDADYLNAVKEVRRNGQDVVALGFSDSSNTELIYEADYFIDLDLILHGNRDQPELSHLIEQVRADIEGSSRHSGG
ncbi:MAG: NYN domain-containing protein, partial [Opitutales bacterium]